MLKKIDSILFATNLSDTSRAAFNHAALLAIQLNAKMVLLHVIEKLPESYESLVISLFGKQQWDRVSSQHFHDARNMLIGKLSSQQIIRAALEQFCRDSGINQAQCGIVSTEIVIKQGDVVDTILQEAAAQQCDLIAMGASKGLVSGTTLGAHIKSTMKKAKVPVLMIPPMING
jgi:nucleotide-binding universal stress UspA family protein